MPDFPLELIEDMASKEAQLRWITNGDSDEYLVPEELLHETQRFCKMAAAIDAPSTARQRTAIRELCDAVNESPDFLSAYDRSNIATLIENDPYWLLIRERASRVLEAFAPPPYE